MTFGKRYQVSVPFFSVKIFPKCVILRLYMPNNNHNNHNYNNHNIILNIEYLRIRNNTSRAKHF